MKELTKHQIRKYKTDRSRLIKGSEKSMYVHEAIAISLIMQTRLSKTKTIKFRSDLGFNRINLKLKKEQSVVISPIKAFSAEKNRVTVQSLKNERIRTDMYFSEHKLVVEIGKKGHIGRN